MGLFAREPIRAGEVMSIIGGGVMTGAEFAAFAASATRYNVIQMARTRTWSSPSGLRRGRRVR
jgi:hypothetical protein